MKRLWFFVALMALSSSASAGGSISFSPRPSGAYRILAALPLDVLRLGVGLRRQ